MVRCSSAVSGPSVIRGDARGKLDRGLGHGSAMLRQRDGAPPAVAGIGLRRDEFAKLQAVDDALDRGGIEIDQAPELILRTGADLQEFGECGELRLRQLVRHLRHEDRGVALHRHPQQKSDLLVHHVMR